MSTSLYFHGIRKTITPIELSKLNLSWSSSVGRQVTAHYSDVYRDSYPQARPRLTTPGTQYTTPTAHPLRSRTALSQGRDGLCEGEGTRSTVQYAIASHFVVGTLKADLLVGRDVYHPCPDEILTYARNLVPTHANAGTRSLLTCRYEKPPSH